MTRKWLQWGSTLLRYAFGICIVIWLVENDTVDLKNLLTVDATTAAFAILLSVLPLVLSAWRVQLLLAALGIDVPLLRCINYNAIGIFYSTILPGGMSGDAVRAYYFWQCKHTVECSKSSLIGALITDRVIGMLMMVLIGLLSATYVRTELGLSLYFLVAAWGLFLFGLLLYVYLKILHKVIPNKSFLNYFSERVQKLTSKLDLQKYPTKTLIICGLLSAVIHISSVLVIYIFANRLNSGLGFGQVMALAPVGLLVNVVPLSPGGLGIGEKGFDVLFSLVGGQQGGNVFMISRVFLYLPALYGALVALISFFRKKGNQDESNGTGMQGGI